MSVRSVQIENEIRVKATPDKVWKALTTEILEWYPHTYGGERVKEIVFEQKVGGCHYEDWGDGAGHLYGTITSYDPPHAYGTRGYLRGGILLENWTYIEQHETETLIKASITCFGDISDEMEEGIRMHGSLDAYEDQLRAYLEA